METVFNVLHVVTAVFIVGPMAILPMTAMRAVRSGQSSHVAALAKSTSIFSWLSLLVVLFGFGLMGMTDPKFHLSFATPWVWISVVLYVIALVLSLFVVVPALRRAAEGTAHAVAATDPGGAPTTAPTGSGYGAIAGGSGVASLCLLVVVVLMVWKP